MNKTTKKTKTETKAKSTKKANVKKPLIIPNTIIKLVIPKKDAADAYNKALKKLAKKVKVDGFRKGNVPAKIAEESLNPQSVVEEALQIIVPELYTKEVKKAGKQPLTHPEFNPISLKKGEDWVLEAHIAERPVVSLKSYETIVKKAKKQADKQLAEQVKKASEAAKKHEKECKDEKHDHKSPEPTAEEKKNFVLQFVYRELIEALKVEVQELLVKEEVRFDLDNLNNQLKQMNIEFEKFLEHRKMTFEQLSTELAAGALSRIQMTFIINEIAKTEKMAVEKADLDAEFAKIEDKNQRKLQETNPRYVDMISQNILRQKVADYLLAIK